MMTSTPFRGFGAVRDLAKDVEEDLRVRHVGQLVGGAPVALPSRVDFTPLLGAIQDQGSSSACVGFAFATALYIRAQISGHPIERPSAKAIYDIARLSDTPGALVDDGSRPRAALDGMQTFGLVAESRWPLTGLNVNDKPPLDVFRSGCGAKLAGHYRIGDGDIAALARMALSKGFPVFFAMPVDGSFMSLRDATIFGGMSGPTLGNHAMVLAGFDETSFLVANSWGAGWGVGGVGRLSDRVLNERAFDAIVPTLLPEKVQ